MSLHCLVDNVFHLKISINIHVQLASHCSASLLHLYLAVPDVAKLRQVCLVSRVSWSYRLMKGHSQKGQINQALALVPIR